MTGTRFASILSTDHDWKTAVADVCSEITNQLSEPASLVFIFLSQQHAEHAASISQQIREATSCDCILGCTGESIIGRRQEVERDPAISVWAAWPAECRDHSHAFNLRGDLRGR